MQLHYTKTGEGFPVIILHGLLGQSDNWQSISKKMVQLSAEQFNLPLSCYAIDQRNHGRSPHSAEFNYDVLAEDLKLFFTTHHINKAHIIGHSMGGKTAMTFALQYPALVNKLVVVDIAPTAYSDKHSEVFEALTKADVHHASSRKEVEESLRNYLNEEATIQFLMKGLVRSQNSEAFEWRFNLKALKQNYASISNAVDSSKPFLGNTLFITGEKSNYINSENEGSITHLFPNSRIEQIKGAGHWVHAESPEAFVNAVLSFLMIGKL